MIASVPSPPAASDTPDSATVLDPDFTGDHAKNRVLYVNTKWFRYGTDDKAHGAAVVLSILLLIVIVVVGLFGLWASNASTFEKLVLALSNAFTLTAGVALGGGLSERAD